MNNKKRSPTAHYIHRTSYSFQERLVSVFVLAGIVVLLGLVFSQLKKQNMFEEYFPLYARLNSAAGLSKETSIQISGFEVGHVSNIEITDDNDILLTLSVARRYHRLIRTDSLVMVSSLSATVFGKSVIEISAGSPQMPEIEEGAEMTVQESISVDTVIANAQETLKTINGMISNIAEVVAAVEPAKISGTIESVNSMMAELEAMAANLNKTSAHIASGEGPVGSVIYDAKMVERLQQSMANIEQTTAQMQNMMATFETESDQVPAMIEDLRAVIDETRATIEASQRIWPISSAISKPEQPKGLVNPMPAND